MPLLNRPPADAGALVPAAVLGARSVRLHRRRGDPGHAESAPTEIRKIKILYLSGCVDPRETNDPSHFLDPDPARCAC